jgi:DNA-binding transcriptional LysR family regulator
MSVVTFTIATGHSTVARASSPTLMSTVRTPQALPYLRTFQLVAAEGSFTRAAKLLALSQPAVSAHIRALEHAYGVRLFEIRRRRAFLTAEGDALLTYTERIFNLVSQAEHALAATHGLERGRLRIAATGTIGVHLLPDVLRQFTRKYPGIRVQVDIAPSEQILSRVRANSVPLGLVEAVAPDHDDLDIRPFANDEMVLVAPAGHPWLRGAGVTRARINGTPVLRREAGSGLRMLVDRHLEEAGIQVPTAMEIGTTEALIAAVRAGIGVAWVPRITVAQDGASGAIGIVDVPGLQVQRTLWIVTQQGVSPSGAAQAFLDVLLGTRAPPKRTTGTRKAARG